MEPNPKTHTVYGTTEEDRDIQNLFPAGTDLLSPHRDGAPGGRRPHSAEGRPDSTVDRF